MSGATVTARSMSLSVPRPNVNQEVVLTADCLDGEVPIGGGVRAEASDATDDTRMHLQESGPTTTGWLGRAAATARFGPGSTFTMTTTVYCLAP